MESIEKLRDQFLDMFPMAGEYSSQSFAYSLDMVPLVYYINNENIVTGKPKEKFDSRKTKIHDDDYQTLYDQLVTEWETEKELSVYDKRIIQTPKGATREGRADRHLQMLTDDEEFKVQNFDEMEELDHSSLYSFADLKAFKLVKNDDD